MRAWRPALMSGLVQVVPEYSGSALEFISVGRLSATSDAAATSRALAGQVAGRGLVAGRPSAAQDGNVIVVTAATAARYGLRSIADLVRVAPRLAFGGPPECPERIYCLRGLRQVYGLRFRAFVPLDATPTQLRDLFTAHTATVDELVALRTDLAPIVVARVVEAQHHPDSDHLWLTKVDAGEKELLEVICGAPNVTAGKLYPFAPVGTTTVIRNQSLSVSSPPVCNASTCLVNGSVSP